MPQGDSGTMMAFGFSKDLLLHIKSDVVMDETGRDQLSVTHNCCLEVWRLLSEGGSERYEHADVRVKSVGTALEIHSQETRTNGYE